MKIEQDILLEYSHDREAERHIHSIENKTFDSAKFYGKIESYELIIDNEIMIKIKELKIEIANAGLHNC